MGRYRIPNVGWKARVAAVPISLSIGALAAHYIWPRVALSEDRWITTCLAISVVLYFLGLAVLNASRQNSMNDPEWIDMSKNGL